MIGYKQYQKGGQRRTMEAGCGWRCVGHPQEVNGKWAIHRRYCNECRETQLEELPEFNREAGLMNGWGGITNRNQQPNRMLTTAVVEGEPMNIITNTNSIQNAMDEARLSAEIIEGNAEPVLTRKQKKRMRVKAKKQAKKEAKQDEGRELIARAIFKNVPFDKVDDFLDKFEDAEGDDAGLMELAELLGEHIELEEFKELLNRLDNL